MSVARGVSKRIAVLALISGPGVCAVTWLLIVFVARETRVESYVPYVRRAFAREQARCEADAERWSVVLEDGSTHFAYDGASLRAQNPAAPELEPGLGEGLRGGEPWTLRMNRWWRTVREGGAIALRVADAGPCGGIRASWPRRERTRMSARLGLLAASVVVVLAVGAVGSALVARPPRPAHRRLRAAAAAVGAERGYASAEESGVHGEDELGELSRCLDRAHDRIRSDAARLNEQRQARKRAGVRRRAAVSAWRSCARFVR